MSSLAPTSQQEALAYVAKATLAENQHPDFLSDKRRRFMRSASIDKIIQFNTYICSQNYFILPSLIAWLRTSQTVLQSHIERSIVFLKTIFLTSTVYRVFVNQLKTGVFLADSFGRKCLYNAYNSDFAAAIEMLAIIVHHSVSSFIVNAKRKAFVFCMYLSILLIFLQFGTCIFLMSKVFLPAGLIFLFVCMYIISQINISVLFNYLQNAEKKLLAAKTDRKPRKFVLGKKTISNLNLF